MKKLALICSFLPLAFFGQKPIFTTATVEEATVYFNSAEITQSVNINNLPSGASEIVIKNVSNFVNENTILVKAPSNVTILSVQYTKNYISEYEKDENSPILKTVRDSIKLVTEQISKLNNKKTSVHKTIELLDKNQQISGTNTGLNITDLSKIVDYYNNKRTELSNSLLTLGATEIKLNNLLNKLNTKLAVNENLEEKISKGKLILQVMNKTAGNAALQVTYLSGQAYWTPYYDLRADNISSPLNMLYKANVVQNTGIDWKKVKLTLSSGIPNQNNMIPILKQWYLNDLSLYNARGRRSSLFDSTYEVVTGKIEKYETYNEEMKQKAVKRVSTVNSVINENQLNISFDIPVEYNIMSNNKPHSIVLNEIKIPATYKYFSIPKLDTDAYLLSEIKDYGKYNLLQGEANIIFDGMYVGKTDINPSQISDTLKLSMGKDKKISVKREKVIENSETRFLSSYKEQTFTYDITIKNNKKETISIELKDQYPLSKEEKVKIDLIENGGAIINKENGELTWNLSLKPNEIKTIRISYKVKYPKDKVFTNL